MLDHSFIFEGTVGGVNLGFILRLLFLIVSMFRLADSPNLLYNFFRSVIELLSGQN